MPILPGRQDTWATIRVSLVLFSSVFKGVTLSMEFKKNPCEGSSSDHMTPQMIKTQDQLGKSPVSLDDELKEKSICKNNCFHKNGSQRPAKFVHPVHLWITVITISEIVTSWFFLNLRCHLNKIWLFQSRYRVLLRLVLLKISYVFYHSWKNQRIAHSSGTCFCTCCMWRFWFYIHQ